MPPTLNPHPPPPPPLSQPLPYTPPRTPLPPPTPTPTHEKPEFPYKNVPHKVHTKEKKGGA